MDSNCLKMYFSNDNTSFFKMDQQNMSLAGGDGYLPLGMVRLNEITGQSLSVVVTLSLFKNGSDGDEVTIEDKESLLKTKLKALAQTLFR